MENPGRPKKERRETMKEFEIAGGSVAGREHVLAGRNNQDSYCWLSTEDALVAIVCDGCGSSKQSEVGAKLGTALIANYAIGYAAKAVKSGFSNRLFSENFWEQIRQDVLSQLRILANAIGGELSETVSEYFLFTVVGALITRFGVSFFSIGDGVFIANGKINSIGPFPDNEPPYLAYGLIESSLTKSYADMLKFQVQHIFDSQKIDSILIGTDGIADMISSAELKMPGKNEIVGAIDQFWKHDCYFKNRDMVRRKLALTSRECTMLDEEKQEVIREYGLLSDDTTLIVIRKKNSA